MNIGKFLLFFALFNSLSQPLTAQTNAFSTGSYVGVGSISGNFPPQTSFVLNLFADFHPAFSPAVSYRLGLIYARKIEALLPEGYLAKNYPYIKGISLKAASQQKLKGISYIEETIGPIVLNDRTFPDINSVDIGLAFSLMAGLDFRNYDFKGLTSGFGTEYGFTFTNTNVSFYSIFFQFQYYF